MIKRTLLSLAIILVLFSTVNAGGEKYGKELTLKEKTSVSAILSSPEKFDGQKVLVEGKILNVCQGMGCWIEVSGETEDEKIMVKVEDGVIVFPKDSKGKTALVEGIVAEVQPSNEEHHDDKEHKHDGDDPCNPKTKTYRINGLGAVIK
ncbi:MAG: DUF4920 domain-containing protein [Melioribacteraceae bacterium]|nr:DUF4920 domain-containing protein [Melioribacteraceae bacterium]